MGNYINCRIHTITLSDIRSWFDSEAPLQIAIPTLNPDLSSNNLVLEYVRENPSPFTAPFMKAVDILLSNAANQDGIRYPENTTNSNQIEGKKRLNSNQGFF